MVFTLHRYILAPLSQEWLLDGKHKASPALRRGQAAAAPLPPTACPVRGRQGLSCAGLHPKIPHSPSSSTTAPHSITELG